MTFEMHFESFPAKFSKNTLRTINSFYQIIVFKVNDAINNDKKYLLKKDSRRRTKVGGKKVVQF